MHALVWLLLLLNTSLMSLQKLTRARFLSQASEGQHEREERPASKQKLGELTGSSASSRTVVPADPEVRKKIFEARWLQ